VNAEEESAEEDVWTHVERRVVREKKLHCEFTGAITASALDGRRYTAKARRWERRYAREESERPRSGPLASGGPRPPTTPGATSRPSECLGPSLRSTGG